MSPGPKKLWTHFETGSKRHSLALGLLKLQQRTKRMSFLSRALKDLEDYYGTYLAVNCRKNRHPVPVGNCKSCNDCREFGTTFVDCEFESRLILNVFEEINY